MYLIGNLECCLVFNAIEKIEIAIRTKMVYYFSLSHGSHWHENSALYLGNTRFIKDLGDLYKEIDRSPKHSLITIQINTPIQFTQRRG